MNRRCARRPSGSLTASCSTPAAPAGGSGGKAAVLGCEPSWSAAMLRVSSSAAEETVLGCPSSRTPDFRLIVGAAMDDSSAAFQIHVVGSHYACDVLCNYAQTRIPALRIGYHTCDGSSVAAGLYDGWLC